MATEEITWKKNYKNFQRHVRSYFRTLYKFSIASDPVKKEECYQEFLKYERLVKALAGYRGK